MAPQLINSNIADRLLSALCDTLLHSLWQGIILAALAGIIVISTRKAASALRYNLLVSVLLLFAIGVAGTFVWRYERTAGPVAAILPVAHSKVYVPRVNVPHINQPNKNEPSVRVFVNGQPQSPPGFGDRWGNFVTGHHDTIVFIWFLIVCARSLQLAFGLYGTYRLRRMRVFAADGQWTERLKQLAESLNIKQAVRLLESGIAKVPMVIGHLKPVVLVPVGLLTALSAEEVEAILIHELAHIKRCDYLVNMLQSMVEIILFFNPAVLWVSALIKAERENCCDDLALAQNNDKLSYIRALVSCEEYQASVPAYAMGLSGGRNTLLYRVKRMANNRNYSLNLFEKTVLAACLVVLGLGISAFTAREDIKKALKTVVATIHKDKVPAKSKVKAAVNDTTKKKQRTEPNNTNELLNNLQLFHPDTLKTAGNMVLDKLNLNIDSLKGTNSLRYSLNAQQPGLPGNLSGLNAKLSGLSASHPLILSGKADTIQFANLAGKIKVQQLFQNRLDTNPMKRLRMLNPQSFDVMHDIGQELYRQHLITDTNHLSISLNERELIVNNVKMTGHIHEQIYRRFGHRTNNAQTSQSNYSRLFNINLQEKNKEIAYELIKENLVKDKSHFTYRLSRDEFSIDGEKQPDGLRRRIIDEFFKPDDNFNISYTFKDPGLDAYRSSANDYQRQSEAYKSSAGDYQRQSVSQQKYWAGQQRRIVDQMQREGLIENRKNLTFTLTDKTFVVNGIVQSGAVFQRYHQEYVPANAGDNWNWNYNNNPGNYPTDTWRSGDWDASSRQNAEERQRMDNERDKKLVADLVQDGLITDPKNVTFSLSDKKLLINGKKQSDDIYKKYKDKYMPDNTGTGWNWTYSHHE